jgi:hypothetical protein
MLRIGLVAVAARVVFEPRWQDAPLVHGDSFGIVISNLSEFRLLLQNNFNLCCVLLPVLVDHRLNCFLVLIELDPIDVIDNRLSLELFKLLPKYLGQ